MVRSEAFLAVCLVSSSMSMASLPSFLALSRSSSCSFICSPVRRMRPHLAFAQVDCSTRMMSLTKPTWMTGIARSMCPKWPGQSSTLPPQVLQRRPGSMTPMCGSIRPISMGKPSSSYVSAVIIFIEDILRASSGDIIANLIPCILRLTPLTFISTPPVAGAWPRQAKAARPSAA